MDIYADQQSSLANISKSLFHICNFRKVQKTAKISQRCLAATKLIRRTSSAVYSQLDSGNPDVLLVLQRQIKVRQTHPYLLKMLGYMFRSLKDHYQAFMLNQVIKTLRTLLGSH